MTLPIPSAGPRASRAREALRRALLLAAVLASSAPVIARAQPALGYLYDTERAGEVVAVERGRVKIKSSFPITPRDRFALVPVTDDAVVRNRGLLVVDRVDQDGAWAVLPRGVYPAVGDRAVPTTLPMKKGLLAPAPPRPLLRARMIVRPAITTNETGFGVIGDLSVDYDFRAPLTLGVVAAPLALATQSAGTARSGRFYARGGYNGDRFAIGVGLGGEVHSEEPAGASLLGWLRVGALDGVRLSVTGSLVASPSSGLRLGGLEAELDLPVAQRFSLFASGGIASSWAHAHAGLKSYLGGNGAPGTILLYTAIGFARVREVGAFNFGVEGFGPSLLVGIELRR